MISRDQIDYIIRILEKERSFLKEEHSYIVHTPEIGVSKLCEITDVMEYNKRCISDLHKMRAI